EGLARGVADHVAGRADGVHLRGQFTEATGTRAGHADPRHVDTLERHLGALAGRRRVTDLGRLTRTGVGRAAPVGDDGHAEHPVGRDRAVARADLGGDVTGD